MNTGSLSHTTTLLIIDAICMLAIMINSEQKLFRWLFIFYIVMAFVMNVIVILN